MEVPGWGLTAQEEFEQSLDQLRIYLSDTTKELDKARTKALRIRESADTETKTLMDERESFIKEIGELQGKREELEEQARRIKDRCEILDELNEKLYEKNKLAFIEKSDLQDRVKDLEGVNANLLKKIELIEEQSDVLRQENAQLRGQLKDSLNFQDEIYENLKKRRINNIA